MLSRSRLAICLAASVFVFFIAGTPAAPAAGRAEEKCSVALLKNRDYYAALSRAIDEAEKEIVMAVFLFKTDGNRAGYPEVIVEKLAGAVKRGVRVEVILEKGKNAESDLDADNNKTARLLRDRGVKVCFDSPQKTTHTKLVVIDRRLTFAGSHNMTQSALKYNNEISVMITSADTSTEAYRYMMSLCE